MLDRDLAELYGVETKSLKQAVRRNMERFPPDFMFELSEDEFKSLRSQSVTSNRGGARYLPFAFTEQGVAMLSSVLTGDRAIQVNIEIMRTFTKIRHMISVSQELKEEIADLRNQTDDRFRIRVDLLKHAIADDRKAGRKPAIVVGNAGTVNTGAIDPLDELADLCAREGLWFHVDGAYGALASVSPRLKPLFRGLERADSVAADPHKWLYVPYEAGATLVREPGRMAEAFRRPAPYLVHDPDSPVLGPALFNERGPELSRSFKALKVWVGLKHHGRSGYAAAVERDVAMARFLADAVRARGDFELLAEPVLSIVGFRYRPAGLTLAEAELDRLNRQIVNRLVGRGAFFLAPTILKGRTAMRTAIVNFRTREDDLRALLDEAARAGREIEEG